MNNMHFRYGICDPDVKKEMTPRWESPTGRRIKPLHETLAPNGKDQMFGASANEVIGSRDFVVGINFADGAGIDHCRSDPDPVKNSRS
jgi:hypothetical protein